MSKLYRGELVRALLLAAKEPATIEQVIEIAEQNFTVEFSPHSDSSPNYLDLIIKS